MNLFILNVFVTPSNPIRMIYKSEEGAKNAAARPLGMDGLFTLADDFGTEIRLTTPPAARVLVNLHEQLDAEIELGLAQAKAQVRAQKRFEQENTTASGLYMPKGSAPIVPFPGMK